MQVKEALVASAPLLNGLVLPSEYEFHILEDLVAALRPIEILTAKLCEANFNVLKVRCECTADEVRFWRRGEGVGIAPPPRGTHGQESESD
jgi:hypothetical protein